MYVPKTKAKTLYCSIDCNDKSRQRYYMKNILENRYIHPYEKEPLTLKIVNKIIYDIKH
jgi:predicted ATP-dependent Lon-type protease